MNKSRTSWLLSTALFGIGFALSATALAQCPHTTYNRAFCNIGQAPVCTQGLPCENQKEAQAYANYFYCLFQANSGTQCQTGNEGSAICKSTYKCKVVKGKCVRDFDNKAEQDLNMNLAVTTRCDNGNPVPYPQSTATATP